MYFCVNEFEVGVNDSIFSGNEQQKVYYMRGAGPFGLNQADLVNGLTRFHVITFPFVSLPLLVCVAQI